MKFLSHRAKAIEGTILIFALIVILAGALVLAAWAQMLATASIYPDTAAEGVKNRIAIENARALARQYILAGLPSGENDACPAALANGWGGFAINASSGFWTNTNQVNANPFSPFGNRCFIVTNLATFSNSDYSVQWRFFVKSRSPIFAGFPLVVHQTASTNLAGTWVPTNRVYYTNLVGFESFPQVPFTSGTNASGSGTNGFIGYFAAPANASTYQTASVTYTNAITNASSTVLSSNRSGSTYTTNYNGGTLTVVLRGTNVDSIIRYMVASPLPVRASFKTTGSGNTYIKTYTNASVTNLTILGSAQTNAMLVVIPATNTATTAITLNGTSSARRLYLDKQSSTGLTLRTATTTNSYTWFLGASLNSTLTINAPTGANRLTITNGFRSDEAITLNSGNLTIVPPPDPGANSTLSAEIIADRVLWIEDGPNRNP